MESSMKALIFSTSILDASERESFAWLKAAYSFDGSIGRQSVRFHLLKIFLFSYVLPEGKKGLGHSFSFSRIFGRRSTALSPAHGTGLRRFDSSREVLGSDSLL
ncbi:hypothetical protein AMTR_s04307p00003520 [Amborella trichopoda]|uniref:Uncharacterized protein n=1 Tax=Amborella trichopoda TaxID=13333 RepID=U5CTZ9_AMBTC|nr:hypothetical protein AMTR_s04307p00003520 [Amborella trichopoda]